MVLNGCQAAGGEAAQLTKRAILHFISQSQCICACVRECQAAGVGLVRACVRAPARSSASRGLLHR